MTSCADSDYRDSLRDAHLKQSLTDLEEGVRRLWLPECPRLVDYYTDHGSEHCSRVLRYLARMVAVLPDGFFAEDELYVLGAAAYLHDIGMQCDPAVWPGVVQQAASLAGRALRIAPGANGRYLRKAQEAIRVNHHFLSAALIRCIRNGENLSGDQQVTALARAIVAVPEGYVADIVEVVVAHSGDTLHAVELASPTMPGLRRRLVAAAFRFADELDICSSRVSLDTVALFELPVENRLFWYLHDRTSVEVRPTGVVGLTCALSPDDYDAYEAIVRELVIKPFIEKNTSVLSIMRSYGADLAIDAGSDVVSDEGRRQLPDEVGEFLANRYGDLVAGADPDGTATLGVDERHVLDSLFRSKEIGADLEGKDLKAVKSVLNEALPGLELVGRAIYAGALVSRKASRIEGLVREMDLRVASCVRGRALAFMILGMHDNAAREADYAIELAKQYSTEESARILGNAQAVRAGAYQAMGKPKKALTDANAALARNPDNRNARYVRATVYFSLGRYEHAARDATYYLSKWPDEGRLGVLLAAARSRSGHLPESADEFRSLLDRKHELPPSDVRALEIGYVNALRKLDRADEAVRYADSLEAAQRAAAWHRQVGFAATEAGDYRRALAEFDRIGEAERRTASVRTARGLALFYLKMYAESYECLLELASSQEEATAWLNLAVVAVCMLDASAVLDAVARARAAFVVDEPEAVMLWFEAAAHLIDGDRAAVDATLRAMDEAPPDDSDIARSFEDMYEALGTTDLANEYLGTLRTWADRLNALASNNGSQTGDSVAPD